MMDPYISDYGILINKLGIVYRSILDDAERRLCSARAFNRSQTENGLGFEV